jgi:hypothetical protein
MRKTSARRAVLSVFVWYPLRLHHRLLDTVSMYPTGGSVCPRVPMITKVRSLLPGLPKFCTSSGTFQRSSNTLGQIIWCHLVLLKLRLSDVASKSCDQAPKMLRTGRTTSCGHICGQAPTMLKTGLVVAVLLVSGVRLQQCSKRIFWGSFRSYLRPGSKNA